MQKLVVLAAAHLLGLREDITRATYRAKKRQKRSPNPDHDPAWRRIGILDSHQVTPSSGFPERPAA